MDALSAFNTMPSIGFTFSKTAAVEFDQLFSSVPDELVGLISDAAAQRTQAVAGFSASSCTVESLDATIAAAKTYLSTLAALETASQGVAMDGGAKFEWESGLAMHPILVSHSSIG